MWNVVSLRCQAAGCDRRPSYGGRGKPLYCSEHKPPDAEQMASHLRAEIRFKNMKHPDEKVTESFLSHNRCLSSLVDVLEGSCAGMVEVSKRVAAKFPGAGRANIYSRPHLFKPDFLHKIMHGGKLYGVLQTEVDEESHFWYIHDEARLCMIYNFLKATCVLKEQMPLVVLRWDPAVKMKERMAFKDRVKLVHAAQSACLDTSKHEGAGLESIQSTLAAADKDHEYEIDPHPSIYVVYINYAAEVIESGLNMCRSLKCIYVNNEEGLEQIYKLLPKAAPPPTKSDEAPKASTSRENKRPRREEGQRGRQPRRGTSSRAAR